MDGARSSQSAACSECSALSGARVGGVSEVSSRHRRRTINLPVVGGVCAAATLLTSLLVPFLTPALRLKSRCLPFLPATQAQVDNVITLLRRHVSPTQTGGRAGRRFDVVDLGSGDGRIVVACAREGYRSLGVELNYWLVLYSRLRAYCTSRGANSAAATYRRKNMWKVDLRDYKAVIIFGTEQVMSDLEQKLASIDAAACDQYILACRYPLPTWPTLDMVGTGLDTVWIYHHTAR